MSGCDLSCPPRREGSRPNCTVHGAGSRTGENPPYGIRGRAAENVATGAGLRPTAKAVDSPPDPTGRRVSALPDRECRVMELLEGNMARAQKPEHQSTPRQRIAGRATRHWRVDDRDLTSRMP